MTREPPTLSYEASRRPNPWARWSLIGGIVLLAGSVVPVCGLAVVPLAWLGVIAGVVGVGLSIRGRRRGLAASVFGTLLCLAAAFIPLGMLGTVPFLAHLGLKVWATKGPPAAPPAAPATAPTSAPVTAPATSPAPATQADPR